jgi:hypothetical protein
MRKPRTIADIKAHPFVHTFSIERDPEETNYIVILADGYVLDGCQEMFCEYTVADVCECLSFRVKKAV